MNSESQECGRLNVALAIREKELDELRAQLQAKSAEVEEQARQKLEGFGHWGLALIEINELKSQLSESQARVKQLEDALKHYTNVTNADGYPIGGVAALALAAYDDALKGSK